MAKIDEVQNYFNELFPKASCSLDFSSAYELLVAVVLSAQCTDNRVNIVTKDLFKVASTPEKMLKLGENKLKEIIHPCGFFNNKAKSILSLSRDLIEKFNGEVPSTMDKLTSLAGVGRKTANVVLANAFNGQTIAVDTHVHRVSKRLGLTKQNSSPYDCEMDLLKIVPENNRTKYHHQTILFGREICKAINPKCEECKLQKICEHFKKRKNV